MTGHYDTAIIWTVATVRAAALTACAVAWLTIVVSGQADLRTPWGDPDLHGAWPSGQLINVPFERPVQFGTRIVTGALSGGAIGAAHGQFVAGTAAGAVGAVLGTLGGRAARGRLAASFGQDRPAALIEDVVAIGGAFLIISALP